jgi:HD domain-containing protein
MNEIDQEEFEKMMAKSMKKEYLATPGKYRVLTWDRWEWSSSGYTLEEALAPAVVSEFDRAEDALAFARNKTWDGWNEYSVYDEYGRYLGGNHESSGNEPRPVIPKDRPPVLMDWLKKAFEEACALHGSQFRKGTKIPYISHLMAVASLVMENGGGTAEVIAALLHDAAEDQGGKATLKKIQDSFGVTVASIVDGCTDSYEKDKDNDKDRDGWRRRKVEFLKRLIGASPSVRLVVAADKLHNARSLLADYRIVGEELWTRFNAPKEAQLWYRRSAVQVLKAADSSPLVAELDRVVTELEKLADS